MLYTRKRFVFALLLAEGVYGHSVNARQATTSFQEALDVKYTPIIHRVFQEQLGQKVLDISDKSKGTDHRVKIVTTPQGRFVVKIPLNEQEKIYQEIVGTRLCSKANLPVPKVLFHNQELLVENCIEGIDLQDFRANKATMAKVYFQLGQMMKQMHSIQGKRFGAVRQRELVGEFDTQKEAVEATIYNDLNALEHLNYYTTEDIQKIKNYYQKHKNFLTSRESVLLHSDVADDNVLVQDGKITGLINFGDLSTGPAMRDFSVMYIDYFGNYRFKNLLAGYGAHDMQEIEFYAFCRLIWRIAGKIEREEYDDQLARMLQLFRAIWD